MTQNNLAILACMQMMRKALTEQASYIQARFVQTGEWL